MQKLIILGSGPAGYTAAVYAARAALDPLLITGSEPGGQLMTTTDVENWPGGAEGLQGPELMQQMEEQCRRLGVRIVNDHIVRADLSAPGRVELVGSEQYLARSLIIATGASAKYLGLDSEQQFLGRGVSACATCDGFFYKNQEVAVVGGGNTAVEEALYLSRIASRVTLLHRRDALRADQTLQKRLFRRVDEGAVAIRWNTVLREVLGDAAGVTGMRIADVPTGEQADISVHGIFIAVGHLPNTGIFSGQLDMDETGYIRVKAGQGGAATATNTPGVFAAGDVSDPVYRQAVTSAGLGCMAALDAEKYLADLSD